MRPLTEVAISGYRSIVDLHFKVKQINVICGPNGSGKSNLYKALRLLAFTGTGGLGKNLLREGGMNSILWAGDRKKGPVRIRLVACSDTLNYEISLGLPSVITSFNRFPMDPEVKEEFIWHGSPRRPGNTYFERSSSGCWILNERGDRSSFPGNLSTVESVLSQLKEPHLYPELSVMSREFQEWRLYDFFRTDPESPLRKPQPSCRTSILAHDGVDLAAALETIEEAGDGQIVQDSLQPLFPGGCLLVRGEGSNRWLEMELPGIRRPLHVAEFSDGTLRYLCLLAALLSPTPAPVLVLNEPENSLHPDVLKPLSKLIARTSACSQIWVTTHSTLLAQLLAEDSGCKRFTLEKIRGETRIGGSRSMLDSEE